LNLIETTKNLIKINSVTGSEEDVIQFIKSELNNKGFKGKILEQEGGLVAIPENSSSRIALVGHVDTVPISENQIKSDDEDLIFGRGSVDMKSGVALIMKSLLESPENCWCFLHGGGRSLRRKWIKFFVANSHAGT
jgi:succinyl-diaminopimelate desuccinylase